MNCKVELNIIPVHHTMNVVTKLVHQYSLTHLSETITVIHILVYIQVYVYSSIFERISDYISKDGIGMQESSCFKRL